MEPGTGSRFPPNEPRQRADRWGRLVGHLAPAKVGKYKLGEAGALGAADSEPIADAATKEPDQDHFEIDNLGPEIESFYDKPFDNHGFVLKFNGPVSFFSGQSPRARPRLILEVEDAPPASGPKLEITYIERKEKYQRYDGETGAKVETQDGQPVSVIDRPLNDLSKKWPSQNQDLVYVAHVKNVGSAASGPFALQAMVDEKSSGAVQQGDALQPGQETAFAIRAQFKYHPDDHRMSPIGARVLEQGGAAEDALTVDQNALTVAVYVEKSFYDKASAAGGFDSWIRGQVDLLNDVYFPYSRFSFARDGVIERIRVDHLEVVPDGTLQGPNALPNGHANLDYDAELGFPASDSEDQALVGKEADEPLLKKLLLQLGCVDFRAVSYPAGDQRLANVGKEGPVPCGLEDLHPGLMGGGDTRDDWPLPLSYSLSYQPVSDEVLEQANLEPTDLLSASTVSELNTDIGKRRGFQGDFLYDTPVATLLTAFDYGGNTISKAKLTFYQMAGGTFSANSRSFTLTTSDDGTVPLFKRDPLTGGDDPIVTGHVLRTNPFGRIDSRGLNGTFLVKAETPAGIAWTPLKLWQLVDADHRGQKIGLLRMYFNLPSDALDPSRDVAEGKSITSSSGSSTDLSKLLDGTSSAEIPLPKAKDSWIEIDLGRDLTVGEVRLVSKSGHFWQNFQILTYETAQKPSEALSWAKELNWEWSVRNRPAPEASGVFSVAYHGPARRFRYLRILNTGPDAEAALAAIKLIPIKQGQ